MSISKRLKALEAATQEDSHSVKVVIYDGESERPAAERQSKQRGGVVVMLPDNHRSNKAVTDES